MQSNFSDIVIISDVTSASIKCKLVHTHETSVYSIPVHNCLHNVLMTAFSIANVW